MDEVHEEGRDLLVNHFSLWRRKMRKSSGLLTTFLHGGEYEEEIRLFNHLSLWRRKMKQRSGLLASFLNG